MWNKAHLRALFILFGIVWCGATLYTRDDSSFDTVFVVLQFRLKTFLFLSAVLVGIFLPTSVFAGTFISGDIDANTTWSSAGNPYIIEADTDVLAGATLTIGRGVIVQFADRATLSIDGDLNINGSTAEPVTLELLNPRVGSHWWDSNRWNINFFHSHHSTLSYANFLDASSIDIFNSDLISDHVNMDGSDSGINSYSSTISLSNTSIKNAPNGAISIYSGSAVANQMSLFVSQDDTNSVLNLYDASQLTIAGLNVFGEAMREVVGVYSSNLDMKDSVLVGGGFGDGIQIYDNRGISASNAHLSNVSLKNFGGSGIVSYGINAVDIVGSDIEDNGIGVVAYADYPSGSIRVRDSVIADNIIGAGFYMYSAAPGFVFDATDNWWGDVSGPYDPISNPNGLGDAIDSYGGNVQFASWLVSSPIKSKCCSNVIFLPGLEGSRLYKQQVFENQLWEPNRNADAAKLYLDATGKSIDTGIYTRDIIKRTNVASAVGLGSLDKDVYESFSESMDKMVTDKIIQSWEAFPYDWRFDYADIVDNGVKLKDQTIFLIPEIEKLASSSLTHKVTIITHSNGGLLAKVLVDKLKSEGKESLIDKIIMVAAPELGTPLAIGAMLHGDELNLPIVLNKSTARGLAENMPSAFNLLPSEKYFQNVLEPVVTFDTSVDKVSNLRTEYGSDISSYPELTDFIKAKDGRADPASADTTNPNVLSSTMLGSAKSLHTNIDAWAPPANINLIQIAGWGLSTTKGYKYTSREVCPISASGCSFILDHELVKSIDGDSTVLSPSATAASSTKYYFNVRDYNKGRTNLDHKSILESSFLEDFVKNIIQNKTDLLQYITVDKPADPNNKNLTIAMHSPVSIDAYDAQGNHTGIVKNPDTTSDADFVEEKIPNSSYEEVGEGKYVYVNGGADTTVKLQGLGAGTFTLDVSNSVGGNVVSESIFTDIPTNPNMEGQIVVTASNTPVLQVDVNGDGKIDATLVANQDLDPIAYLTILKKTLDGFDITAKVKTALIKRIDSIIASIEKGKTRNAIKKVKDFNKRLKVLSKQKMKKNAHKKINKEDSNTLTTMLNELLDLLEAK